MERLQAIVTPSEAMQMAIDRVGCDDFGPDGFLDGLRRTLDAFATMPLNRVGREAGIGKIVADLSNRLRIEHWYKTHPRVKDETVEGPVLVCGLPRTGTTATVGMLATDPRYRFLRAWEAINPVPPPIAGDEAHDARALAARQAAQTNSSLKAQHIADPDGPEEDLVMLAPLNMHAYNGAFPMPDDYIDWWSNACFASTYTYHRRVLKLLQSRRGPRLWLLKAPLHLFKLEDFAAQYPKAKFVWTHRDPARVIPSVSSLQYRLHAQRCEEGALDKRDYGMKFLRFWSDGMARALKAREAIGEDRFLDVWNDDVVCQPLETLEALYENLGFTVGPEFRSGLVNYARRNAKGVHGDHHYSAREYGISTDMIRQEFSHYIDRFGL